MYICMYVCMYVYIYMPTYIHTIYIHTHTHTHTQSPQVACRDPQQPELEPEAAARSPPPKGTSV